MLDDKIRKAYPQITGTQGSWAGIMDMIDEFWAAPPVIEPIPPTSDTTTTEPSKTKKKRRRRKKKEDGWTEVKARKAPVRQERIAPVGSTTNMPKKTFSRKKNATIILKGLPYQGTSTLDLYDRFIGFGQVASINILKKPDGSCKGIAFIEFSSKAEAQKAAKEFSYKGRWIRVNMV